LRRRASSKKGLSSREEPSTPRMVASEKV